MSHWTFLHLMRREKSHLNFDVKNSYVKCKQSSWIIVNKIVSGHCFKEEKWFFSKTEYFLLRENHAEKSTFFSLFLFICFFLIFFCIGFILYIYFIKLILNEELKFYLIFLKLSKKYLF